MKKVRRAAVLGSSLADASSAMQEEMDIRSIRAKSNRAIAACDIAGVSASLAEDFVVVIGDGTFLSRDEYIAAFAHGFEQPLVLSYERTADSVRVSDSLLLASEQGRWVARLPDGWTLFTGTYMAMWRRTEVAWKLRSELFVLLTHADLA